jgi:hypothetical protein
MGDISHAAVRPVGQHSADGVIAFIYRWLFDHEFAPGFHRQVERAIALLILISVAAIVLEHIPEIYLPHAQSFHWFDVITVAIFSVEYLLVCTRRLCIPSSLVIVFRACVTHSAFMPWSIWLRFFRFIFLSSSPSMSRCCACYGSCG